MCSIPLTIKTPCSDEALDKVESSSAPGHVCCAGVRVPEQERRCCAGRAQGRRILINMWQVLRSDERFAGKGGDDGPHSFCPERWMADDAQRAGAWRAPWRLLRPPPCAACPAALTQGRGSETRGSTRGSAGAAVKALQCWAYHH